MQPGITNPDVPVGIAHEEFNPQGKSVDVTDHAKSHESHHHHHRRRRKKSIAPKKVEEDVAEQARPQTPWQMFECHVKNIGDDTTNYSVTKNDAKFKSSDIFQKVVDEINTKKQMQELKRLEKLRQLQLEAAEKAAAEHVSENESETEDDEDDDDSSIGESEDTVSLAVKLKAQRGWALIKRKIQEKQMEKKNNGAMLNWKVLKATMSNMSDMEKARQDLYERYLYKNDEFMGEMKIKDKEAVFGVTIHKRERPTRIQSSIGRGKQTNRMNATSRKKALYSM